MTAISAIMTAHREGLLANASIVSFNEAVVKARYAGISVETLVILDRPDSLTRNVFETHKQYGLRIVESDHGDPALSRNLGISESQGQFATFLDSDDLWSENWLVESYSMCSSARRPTIAHSECNLVFGSPHILWFHADSEEAGFDPSVLLVDNYWDAMCFGPREIFVQYPFVKNDISRGYGHEDWHWNCVTLGDGVSHRPVPGTIHAKRRREGSQSARCSENDVIIWPTPMSDYRWRMPKPKIRNSV